MRSKPVVFEDVKGSELPPEWASKAGVRPDERVRVVIGPNRDEIARRLKAAMDRAGAEASASGVPLEEIVSDIPGFPLNLIDD